jgi:hypothetical protein
MEIGMSDVGWKVGQRAVISRTTVVTIERVTPTGRVTAGGRKFGAGGWEAVKSGSWRVPPRLELLTPEIEAEMSLVVRGRAARLAAHAVLDDAYDWLRTVLDTWNGSVPDAEDVDKAERLAAAIQGVMGTKQV